MKNEIYLGIDVSKGYADFILLNQKGVILEESFRLIDNQEGHKELFKLIEYWIKKWNAILYCGVESTGGYENNWYAVLKGLQFDSLFVTRLNPKVVKAISDANLRRTITDAVSAENIALYLAKFPERVDYGTNYTIDAEFKEGRNHLTAIRMHIKQRTQLLNQLEGWLYEFFPEILSYCRNGVPNWVLKLLARYPSPQKVMNAKNGLTKIKGITNEKAKRLKGIINKNNFQLSEYYEHLISTTAMEILHKSSVILREESYLEKRYKDKEEVKLLTSIPCIGIASAVKIVLEIEDISRFENSKKMASYFGVHPSFKQSGDGQWKSHMSKRGRSTVRATLYMCCMSGIQHNPILKPLYDKCKEKGMNFRQASGVIMHKLLRIIYGVLKSGKPFNAEIDLNNQENAEYKRALEKKNLLIATNEKERKLYRYQELKPEGPISRRRSVKIKKQVTSQSPNEGENAGLLSAKTKV